MEALESRYEKVLKGGDFEERQYIVGEKASNIPVGKARITITLFWKRATSAGIGLMIAEKNHVEKDTELRCPTIAEGGLRTIESSQGGMVDRHRRYSKRGLPKVGFKEEGVLHEEVFFDDKYHDAVVFGLLRNEYEGGKGKAPPAYHMPTWLSAALVIRAVKYAKLEEKRKG